MAHTRVSTLTLAIGLALILARDVYAHPTVDLCFDGFCDGLSLDLSAWPSVQGFTTGTCAGALPVQGSWNPELEAFVVVVPDLQVVYVLFVSPSLTWAVIDLPSFLVLNTGTWTPNCTPTARSGGVSTTPR